MVIYHFLNLHRQIFEDFKLYLDTEFVIILTRKVLVFYSKKIMMVTPYSKNVKSVEETKWMHVVEETFILCHSSHSDNNYIINATIKYCRDINYRHYFDKKVHFNCLYFLLWRKHKLRMKKISLSDTELVVASTTQAAAVVAADINNNYHKSKLQKRKR